MHMLTVKPFSVLTLYGLGDMLDIPQQNPLKYGFSGIEIVCVCVCVCVCVLIEPDSAHGNTHSLVLKVS